MFMHLVEMTKVVSTVADPGGGGGGHNGPVPYIEQFN